MSTPDIGTYPDFVAGNNISSQWANSVKAGIVSTRNTANSAQTLASNAAGASGSLWLDSMPGATDDDKLTAAMQSEAAATYPRPIRLSNRLYTFSLQRNLYDGFCLIGAERITNAELGRSQAKCTTVQTSGGGIWLNAAGGLQSASQNWDVTIRNIAFKGSSSTQWMGGGAVLWCMNLRDCSWSDYKSILGSQATKLLINLCLLDGWLSFNNSYNGSVHVGGSDCSLFTGMTNIDGATAYLNAGGANGQAHIWLDYMSATYVGPAYFTGEAGWTCLRVTGPAFNQAGADQKLVAIYGAKFEGHGQDRPCNGSLIRIEGGLTSIRDCWTSFGMANPTAMGHTPTDAGVINQTGGQVLIEGCVYDHASTVAETVPYFYQSGGVAVVKDIMTCAMGGSWTGKPRVHGGGTLTSDSSVTLV